MLGRINSTGSAINIRPKPWRIFKEPMVHMYKNLIDNYSYTSYYCDKWCSSSYIRQLSNYIDLCGESSKNAPPVDENNFYPGDDIYLQIRDWEGDRIDHLIPEYSGIDSPHFNQLKTRVGNGGIPGSLLQQARIFTIRKLSGYNANEPELLLNIEPSTESDTRTSWYSHTTGPAIRRFVSKNARSKGFLYWFVCTSPGHYQMDGNGRYSFYGFDWMVYTGSSISFRVGYGHCEPSIDYVLECRVGPRIPSVTRNPDVDFTGVSDYSGTSPLYSLWIPSSMPIPPRQGNEQLNVPNDEDFIIDDNNYRIAYSRKFTVHSTKTYTDLSGLGIGSTLTSPFDPTVGGATTIATINGPKLHWAHQYSGNRSSYNTEPCWYGLVGSQDSIPFASWTFEMNYRGEYQPQWWSGSYNNYVTKFDGLDVGAGISSVSNTINWQNDLWDYGTESKGYDGPFFTYWRSASFLYHINHHELTRAGINTGDTFNWIRLSKISPCHPEYIPLGAKIYIVETKISNPRVYSDSYYYFTADDNVNYCNRRPVLVYQDSDTTPFDWAAAETDKEVIPLVPAGGGGDAGTAQTFTWQGNNLIFVFCHKDTTGYATYGSPRYVNVSVPLGSTSHPVQRGKYVRRSNGNLSQHGPQYRSLVSQMRQQGKRTSQATNYQSPDIFQASTTFNTRVLSITSNTTYASINYGEVPLGRPMIQIGIS
jgi:hypothetical protein